MSKFYTAFNLIGSTIYLRYIDDNGKKQDAILNPGVSLYTPTMENTGHYSHLNQNVKKVEFDNIKTAKEFLWQQKGMNQPLFGYPRFEYSAIHELFPGFKCEFDQSLIDVAIIDIETTVANGFPDIKNPIEEITLIAVEIGGIIHQFMARPTVFKADDVVIHVTPTEKDMLIEFLDFYEKLDPEVISGWNVNYFDMPYMYARMVKIVGPGHASRLSHFGKCKLKDGYDKKGRAVTYLEMIGNEVLDYMQLYQKFELSPRDNMKLGYIANVELDDNKIDYVGSFESFYTDHWDLFVEYNAHDARLVRALDNKLKFITIALSMAYAAKVNYSDVYMVTRVWDNIIANFLSDKNLHVESYISRDGDGEGYEGAFVKPTIAGLYQWMVSFDVTSLYPSLIIQYNISPETMVPKHLWIRITPNDILMNTDLYQRAKENADNLNATLCANGAMFYRDVEGYLPHLTNIYFQERKTAKKEMQHWESELMRAKQELAKRGK